MASVRCILHPHFLSSHVQQLFTGFQMLHNSGLIELAQEIDRGHSHGNRAGRMLYGSHAHLKVGVECSDGRQLTLFFDNHDDQEIENANLDECDIYFKRSFSQSYIARCHEENRRKIRPLGLNYLVFPNQPDLFAVQRSLYMMRSWRRKFGGALSGIDTRNTVRFQPRLRDLQALPDYQLEPRVLFMVTAYDPYDKPDRLASKIEERIRNNEFRAECIRLLRKELGSRFYGGFVHNDYTVKNFGDLLIDTPSNATKRNYLRILKEFPICVATTGLHGSIGWKLAEYVAFSKAIVSERLSYEVPGCFAPQANYLEFLSPDECVNQSVRLLDDCKLRYKIMTNNAIYYQNYVRPDRLILNAVITALQECRPR